MENKIKYDGRLIPISSLPFTKEDNQLIYEDFKKGVPLPEIAKKWKLTSKSITKYALILIKTKGTAFTLNKPIDWFNLPKKEKENIWNELYPQYKWEELTPYEVRFYEEYNKGRILRKSKLNNIEYERTGRR
jgi:hypothetical protein